MTQYYLDSTLGNNTWDGLYQTFQGGTSGPWADQAAIRAHSFSAGDIISFKCGETFNENFNMNWSGTSGNPITFNSYGSGDKPKITKIIAVDNTGWTEFATGKYSKNIGSEVIWFFEDSVIFPKSADANLNEAYACWFYSYNGGLCTVYYKPSSGTPLNHTLTMNNTQWAIYDESGTSDITIDGLEFYQCRAIKAQTTRWTINDIDFVQCNQSLSIATPVDTTIQNNTWDYSGILLYVYTSGDGLVVQDNTVTHGWETPSGNPLDTVGDIDGFSIQQIKNSTIQRNNISGTGITGSGIVLWWNLGDDSSNNMILRNYIHDLPGGGIRWSGGSPDAGTGGSVVAYNVIANYGTGPSGLYGGLYLGRPSVSQGVGVYNNVCYNGDVGIWFNGSLFNYFFVKNNIVANMSLYMAVADDSLKNNLLSNNCYMNGGDAYGSLFYITGTAQNWTYWKNTWGGGTIESGSITSDPLFVNAAAGTAEGFKLQSSSPCVNAGMAVGLTTDYGGNPIIDNPDIGAWEQTTYRKVYIGGLYCNITVV